LLTFLISNFSAHLFLLTFPKMNPPCSPFMGRVGWAVRAIFVPRNISKFPHPQIVFILIK
ncbi:MAG: hypothetical protein ACK53E_24635, partial [Pseudanabaena sp.]